MRAASFWIGGTVMYHGTRGKTMDESAPVTPMMRKAITVPCTALYTALDRMGPKTQKRKTISQSRVRRAHHAGVQQASAERSSRLIGHFEMTCVSASAVVSTESSVATSGSS